MMNFVETASSFSSELRLAARSLRRASGFFVAGTLLLGLGIGFATAIFGAIDAMLLDPFVPDDSRVFVLHERSSEASGIASEISLPHFHDWRALSSSFSEMAAFGPTVSRSSLFFDDGETIEVETAGVSPTFFDALGVSPLLGRGFRIDEDEPAAERVVVLSFELWQGRFGGDDSVLGRSFALEQTTRELHTVVGVMPRGFDFPRGARIWRPLRKEEPIWPGRGFQFLFAVARLAPGATIEQARNELDAVIPRIYRDNDLPQAEGRRVNAVPIVDYVIGEKSRRALWTLLAAVGMLLLIACVNVAGLFVSRSLLLRRETAVRCALGASRGRLVRTFLAEALVLASAGGALGLFIAHWTLGFLLVIAASWIPRLEHAGVDARTFLFALAVAASASLLVAVAPSVEAVRLSPAGALAAAGAGIPGRTVRLGHAFVFGEVSLTVVLVVGASLFASSYLRLLRAELGYQPEHVLLFDVKGPSESYPSVASRRSLLLRSMARLRAVPGVSEVGTVLVPPFAAGTLGWDLWWVAESQDPPWETLVRTDPETGEELAFSQPSPSFMEDNPRVNWEAVSGSYFETMRIPLLRGRTFTDDDVLDSPRVVIVSESFAARLWPGDDPIGKRLITLGHRRDENGRAEWQIVVGVVGDARYREVTDARFDIYIPYQQSEFVPASLVLRSSGDPSSVASALRNAVAQLDPNLRLVRMRTMTSVVSGELVPFRFQSTLVSTFAAAALLLAVFGVFGAVSQGVAQRARELGLRMALGAGRADILRVVVSQGMRPVLLGLLAGLPAAFLAARATRAHLYEVAPEAPAAYLLSGLLIGAAAVMACYLPARRAARLSPSVTLRSE